MKTALNEDLDAGLTVNEMKGKKEAESANQVLIAVLNSCDNLLR